MRDGLFQIPKTLPRLFFGMIVRSFRITSIFACSFASCSPLHPIPSRSASGEVSPLLRWRAILRLLGRRHEKMRTRYRLCQARRRPKIESCRKRRSNGGSHELQRSAITQQPLIEKHSTVSRWSWVLEHSPAEDLQLRDYPSSSTHD